MHDKLQEENPEFLLPEFPKNNFLDKYIFKLYYKIIFQTFQDDHVIKIWRHKYRRSLEKAKLVGTIYAIIDWYFEATSYKNLKLFFIVWKFNKF